MKDKNLPDDIKAKSLDELREILNSLLTKIETSPNLENSADDYQKLIKVNNLIEKKFQSLSKEISNNSKSKIDEIIKKNAKKIK
jgi:plasmid stability protein|tara:strand:+ start:217 stop:468 length:252 start_codon:yes stop_codon:yes gene_type:complete